ncbi:MAG: prolyl oligopeptidase family serine peptidase [Chthoniobacter sp.]|uniref:alpha/beta hydrolase n=1 Tax=Chthoniobacter sp. TaxID=2510640 RepID=UPI0032AE7997
MNRRGFLQLLGAACGGALADAENAARHPLMEYPDPSGAWRPVRTPADWAQRRRAILAAMQTMMGPVPGPEKRCPLDMQVREEVDAGTYVRRAITYASEPGSRVPAYLLIPKRLLSEPNAKTPAILCLHPTNNTDGNKTVIGLGKTENRQYAKELAERGFVTLAPAYPLLADYQPDLTALGYVSGTMKAIWDNMRGLDLLDALPFVQHDKYAAIGHSLGGHNSVYTAAFDERLKAVVSSCGLDSFTDYKGGDITGWTSTRYMPRLAAFKGRSGETPFDFDELLAALAPRPVMLSAPLHDANFRAASVDRITTAARAVYALQGAPDALVVEHPDCEHDFPETAREKAYAFLAKALRTAA